MNESELKEKITLILLLEEKIASDQEELYRLKKKLEKLYIKIGFENKDLNLGDAKGDSKYI